MKKLLAIIFIVPSLVMVSCKKQPTACLSADKTTINVGETVNFSSCATDAESVSWDFGNGNKAEGSSASQTFNAPGSYLVTMTAKSKKDKKWDKASIVINVKEPVKDRFITKILLKSFPSTPPQGGTWDTTQSTGGLPFTLPGNAPEPDINVVFKASNNSWSLNLGTTNDVTQSQLPLTWNY
jgi:PKD repeat protein